MASRKRNRQQMDDSDDDEPSFGKQILPVADLPPDFDGEPMDGLEYLFTVRRDARTLPHITRVANPYEIPESVQQPLPVIQALGSTAASILPSMEWRQVFLKGFRNFQKNIAQPTIHVHNGSKEKIMPDKKARDLWWSFLLGRPESDWNPPRLPKSQPPLRKAKFSKMRAFGDEPESDAEIMEVEDQPSTQETWRINEEGEVELAAASDVVDALPTPSSTPAPPDETNVENDGLLPLPSSQAHNDTSQFVPREPTPSVLQKIDHRTSLHLLMYFTYWINLHLNRPLSSPGIITESHARWMFVLLSKVEDYVSADDMSLLRNLVRACLGLLKELTRYAKMSNMNNGGRSGEGTKAAESTISYSSCWLISTAVIEAWGQKDLWMDAEAMLASV